MRDTIIELVASFSISAAIVLSIVVITHHLQGKEEGMNDLQEAWDEMMAKDAEEQKVQSVPIQKQSFQIDTEEKASWVIGKRNALESRRTILKAQYDAMKKDIDNDLRAWEFCFLEKLKWFVRSSLPKDKKSVKFLTGTAGFRSSPGSLAITDEEKAMAWAEKNCPDAIVVKKSLSVSTLKEYMKKTGEVPDGTEFSGEEENFYVKEESK